MSAAAKTSQAKGKAQANPLSKTTPREGQTQTQGLAILGLQQSAGNRATSNLLQNNWAKDFSPSNVKYSAPPRIGGEANGQSLDTNTRVFMESRFGEDFSGVRVHTNPRITNSAESKNAQAYTVGNDIVFAQGHY